MNDDWSLVAVLRGCSSTAIKATKTITTTDLHKKPKSESMQGLHDLLKPVFTMENVPPPPPPPSPPVLVTPKSTQLRTNNTMNQAKQVYHVPIKTSDKWTWRKYGRKYIKGSPYPRYYHRCSSSKECPARKRTEKNKFNPDVLIVTYLKEHNHPVANCRK